MLLLRKAKRGMGKLVVFLHEVRGLALQRVALVSISQPLPLLLLFLSPLVTVTGGSVSAGGC